MTAAANDGGGGGGPMPITADMLASASPRRRIDFERGMRTTAPLTIMLSTACVVAFAWQCGSGGLESAAGLVASGAVVRDRLMLGEFWRLATALFLHGGIDHLIGNVMALFVLGMACEHAFGWLKMAAIYLLAGVAGGLASTVINPVPTVGASGAIFGLMGCLVAVLAKLRGTVQVRDGRIGTVVGLWAAYQMALGFADPLVANFAHIGGFVTGALLGLLIPPHAALRPQRSSPTASRHAIATAALPGAV